MKKTLLFVMLMFLSIGAMSQESAMDQDSKKTTIKLFGSEKTKYVGDDLYHIVESEKTSSSVGKNEDMAHYLQMVANSRIAEAACLGGSLTFAGIGLALSGNVNVVASNVAKSKSNTDATTALFILGAACGVGALIALVCDAYYSVKLANAARMELRPAKEGLGLNVSF